MSKRFGRNQKRRMRQEIEALDVMREHDKRAIDNLRSRVEDHRRFLEYALELVGPDSILNPEPRIVETYGYGDQTRVPVYREPLNIWHDRAVAKVESTLVRALNTQVVRSALCPAMHFRARLRGGEVAYALTDEAIATMPTRRLEAVLHEHIARQLAHQLALVLKR